MNKLLLFVLLCTTLLSCNIFTNKKNIAGPEEKQKMMDADRAFSKMSAEKGMKNAFLEYIDSNGILLRPNHFPIAGADAIDFLIQIDDAAFTMQWEPKGGAIAQSGEVGLHFWFIRIKTIYKRYHTLWHLRKHLEKTARWQLEICIR
jgi:hypothetical protein